MDARSGRLVGHYGSWLQIVLQIVENHGAALCARTPTVVEDPATRQFRWGIPSVHAVAATEVLRNYVTRRTLLPHAVQPEGGGSVASPESAANEEQRLEQLEQSVLGVVISRDASAVYGMMSELHVLLQVSYVRARGPLPAAAVPGTRACVALSMAWASYGLAPILGFEEHALAQAMDMAKLAACLRGMKRTALARYYAPLLGVYPRGAGAAPAYAEHLLLRMATTLFNIDWPWGAAADALAPARIPDAPQPLVLRLLRALRLTAVHFALFSLDTSCPAADTEGALCADTEGALCADTEGVPCVDTEGISCANTAAAQLIRRAFMVQPHSDDLARILAGDVQAPGAVLTLAETVELAVDWVVEFVQSARAFVAPRLLRAQCAAALEHVLAGYIGNRQVPRMVKMLELVPFAKWRALAAVRFEGGGSAAGVVWACVQGLRGSEALRGLVSSDSDVPGADEWQSTVSLCCPDAPFLAYVLATQCGAAARELVRPSNSGGVFAAALSRLGVDALRRAERVVTAAGAQEWAAGELLFVPQMYAGGGEARAAERFAQQQLAPAVRLLATGSLAEWAQQLGVPAARVGSFTETDMRVGSFTETDMRQVACLLTDYASNAPDMFTMLPRLLLLPQPATANSDRSDENPFMAPNILAKLPPIESQTNPNACGVDAAVRQWRRAVAQQGFAHAGRCIQELVARCYPSSAKHYLDAVIVRFMEAEPVAGVELVVGSVAAYMWKSQLVYSRRAGPFYAVRGMFAGVGSPRAESSVASGADDRALRLAHSHAKPVFNAVVGGRVRAGSRGGGLPAVPTATEREDEGALAWDNGDGDGEDVETVRSPVACLRILLLLTGLRYGNSMRDTPINMWLTDCLDLAPAPLLRQYFEHAVSAGMPVFSPELPVEPDWALKIRAVVALWAGDRRLRARPLVAAACAAVMRHVLRGEGWAERWHSWAPVLRDVLAGMFARPNPSPAQAEIVHLMLLTPLGEGAAIGSHPIGLLADLLVPARDRGLLAFADCRDWFLTHVLGQLLDGVMDDGASLSSSARAILAAVLESPAALAGVVPWLDIAASLVQNVPLGNGCPAAMDGRLAKLHFVGYLSPLARVLLAIAAYVGDEDFDWAWLAARLAAHVAGCAGEALRDAVDAMLDTYTYSSVAGLRGAIADVLDAGCGEVLRVAVEQVFGKRPLDVFTLHSLRPQELSALAPLTPGVGAGAVTGFGFGPPSASGDAEAAFRPAAEVYPLARRVVAALARSAGPPAAAQAVGAQLWAVAEEPDVRRNLIALKPRLIPKEHRPAASQKSVSQETVLQTTSGSLHIPAEAAASAAAYALDRSVYLLGLLAASAEKDCDAGVLKDVVACLARSRTLLAVLMVAVGDSMRQFATLGATRELLASLWAAGDDEEVVRVWAGVNFYVLAQRLNSQLPEEFTTWSEIK
ncbi:hypothetical protein IWW50_004271 [Coemansia erecta]|nr:hypothetical protein IWW50_004271 [Coemansia erecta]